MQYNRDVGPGGIVAGGCLVLILNLVWIAAVVAVIALVVKAVFL